MILLVLHLPREKKVNNVTMSSPVSKKKLAFTRAFTTTHATPGYEPNEPGKLEDEDKCNTPFERYTKKVESDIARKKSELRKLELEDQEISLKILKVKSHASDGNMCRNYNLRLGHTA